MRKCTTLARVAAVGLATAAVLVPAANAMPDGPAYPTPTDPRQLDMHASTVPQSGATQDRRGEAAADGTDRLGSGSATDLRGEAAAGGSRPATRPGPQGPPTWPENPTPIAPRVAPAPATAGGGTDDDFPVVLIAIAGALALSGVMAFTATRLRARTHAAH